MIAAAARAALRAARFQQRDDGNATQEEEFEEFEEVVVSDLLPADGSGALAKAADGKHSLHSEPPLPSL